MLSVGNYMFFNWFNKF